MFKPYSDFVANVRLKMNPKETDLLPSFHDNNDGDDGGGDGGDVVMTTVRRWERGEGDGLGDDGEMAGVLMVLRLTRHTPGIGSTGKDVRRDTVPGQGSLRNRW